MNICEWPRLKNFPVCFINITSSSPQFTVMFLQTSLGLPVNGLLAHAEEPSWHAKILSPVLSPKFTTATAKPRTQDLTASCPSNTPRRSSRHSKRQKRSPSTMTYFKTPRVFSQDVHVTIQPFDFILWYPLLYSVTTIFHSFTSLQATSGQKCESRGVPSLESSMDARQSLTNLPEVNLKLRGFRLVVPSRIEPHKTKETLNRNLARSSDLFAIQAKALVVSSRFDNPTSRLVVDKKLSKALTAFARSRRGSAVERRFGDTQYQIEMKGLRVWSGCWDELCRMLPSKDTSRIERDLLEQNPAFEWNTYSG